MQGDGAKRLAAQYADNDPSQAEDDRLLQNQNHDERLGGAQRAQNADLTRTLGDCRVHRKENHHDSDADRNENNRCDGVV